MASAGSSSDEENEPLDLPGSNIPRKGIGLLLLRGHSCMDGGEWWFWVVLALIESRDPKQYIQRMKQRDPELAKGWVQIVHTLPIPTGGGPQPILCAMRRTACLVGRLYVKLNASGRAETAATRLSNKAYDHCGNGVVGVLSSGGFPPQEETPQDRSPLAAVAAAAQASGSRSPSPADLRARTQNWPQRSLSLRQRQKFKKCCGK